MITRSSPSALSVWPGICRSRTLVLPLSFSDACVNNQSVIYCTDNHITFETHSWNDHPFISFCSLCLARAMSLSHPRSSSIFLWCCVNNQSVIYCTDNHITFETHSWNDHLVISCSLCLARAMSLSHPRSSSIFLWCLREQPVCNILHWQPYYLWNS